MFILFVEDFFMVLFKFMNKIFFRVIKKHVFYQQILNE